MAVGSIQAVPQFCSAQQTPSSLRDRGGKATGTGKIAIIDDEPTVTEVVRRYLEKAGYRSFAASTTPTDAMSFVVRENPDVLLLDIEMPTVNGLDVLQAIKTAKATQHLPVLMLTAEMASEVKRRALDIGASDFLAKPVDPHDLILRVRNALERKAYHDQLSREHARLEKEVRRRTAELTASREEVVHCLARAAEYRDDQTGRHVERVGKFVGIIARELGFDDERIELLELAAQLHDLGKIAIPDSILQKPGKLNPDERAFMRKHCAFAKKMLLPIPEDQAKLLRSHAHLGTGQPHVRHSPLLALAARIAQTHHEWWDGTGYPLGLAGEDIPIEGRMTAVADVYDALSSQRPYKKAFSHDRCFTMLEEKRGTHFDPQVVDAFFARIQQIIEIQIHYKARNDDPTRQFVDGAHG